MKIKKMCKYSRINFYIINTFWNLKFWLFCKKIYKTFTYEINSSEFILDAALKMSYKKNLVNKKRFVGYLYKNQIYYDNPGFPINDRALWEHWKKLGLIN